MSKKYIADIIEIGTSATIAGSNILTTTSGYATTGYVDNAISGLVNSAPTTLDTLNEIAAALGNDANFATTVTNSIGLKWTQDNTKISNWDTAYGWGNHAAVGYLTSFTETDPIFSASPSASITSTNISNWNTSYGWGNHSGLYLPIGGGTLTGPLAISESGNTLTIDPHAAGVDIHSTGNIAPHFQTNFTLYTGAIGSGTQRFRVDSSGNVTATGTLSASGYNNSNWDTAYGWGDHAAVGYLTSLPSHEHTYIRTVAGTTTADAAMPTTGYALQHFLAQGPSGNDGHTIGMTWTGTSAYGAQIWVDTDPNNIMAFRSRSSTGVWTGWNTLVHSGNIGSQSVSYASNAGTLDSIDSSQFLRSDANDTATGALTFTSANNSYNGHFYLDAYDANGNHYPHFRDGSNGNGVDINWRLYQGSSNIVHYWRIGDTTFANSLRSDVDLRAPIVYDSNNTAYYVNPASTSNLASLNVANNAVVGFSGSWNATNMPGSRYGGYGSNGGEVVFQRDNPNAGQMSVMVDGNFYAGENNGFWSLYSNNDYNSKAGMWANTNGYLFLDTPSGGRVKVKAGSSYGMNINHDQIWTDSGNLYLQYSGSGNIDMNQGGGYAFSQTSLRAPIFYDLNNTGYYLDPASTTKLNTLIVDGYADFQGDAAIGGGSGYGYFKGYTGNWNHMITVRGSISGSTSSPTIAGAHNTTFVEYAENNATTGWFFKSSSTGTYEEVAKITRDYASFTQARAPIFYDTNNTNYYLDPNSTSYLQDLNLSGQLQNNPREGRWYAKTPYLYTGGVLYYYWVKVANLTNGDSYAYLEYYSKRDSNYPGATTGYVHMATYAGSSMSLQHDMIGGNGQIDPQVWIDNNRDVWVRMGGAAWNSTFRWRWKYATGITTYDGSTAVTSQPANSSEIPKGYSRRYTWGNVASYADYDNTVIVKSHQAFSDARAQIFYDYANTGYYGDFASVSNFNVVQMQGGWRENGGGNILYWHNGNELNHYTNGGTPGQTLYINYRDTGNGGDGGAVYVCGSHFLVNNDYARHDSDMRAPVFYDYNNTGYYVDPTSTSNISNLHLDGYIHVSRSNTTGNGIILADDGDIVDLNDAYCSMRFSYGVRVFSANRGGSAVHTLHSNGTFTASGDVVAYSDARVKENIEPITNALEMAKNIEGVYYNRTDKDDKSRKVGVIAQQIKEVLPEVVTEDDQGMLGVSYGNITAVLIEAIKELSNKVEQLEAKINGAN